MHNPEEFLFVSLILVFVAYNVIRRMRKIHCSATNLLRQIEEVKG